MSRARFPIALITPGLVAGIGTAAAGVLVVGMGHGWNLPLQYGAVSIALWPLALLRLAAPTSWRQDTLRSLFFLVPGLILALWLDVVPGPPRIPLSEALLPATPAALWLVGRLLEPSGWHTAWGDVTLLALAAGADTAAMADYQAFIGTPPGSLIAPWMGLWLGWQAVTLVALIKHSAGRRTAHSIN